MHGRVVQRLIDRMHTYEELAELLTDQALAAELPVRSNSIGGQLWCVVGARESYARAIVAGRWSGFTCSLTADGARRRDDVLRALRSSAGEVREVARGPASEGDDWTDAQEGWLLDLLEHEAQHQGQLIRYIYGLGLTFPESWKRRWALD